MKCGMCVRAFKPANVLAVYCSSACRQKAYRTRERMVRNAVKLAGGPKRAPVARIRREVNELMERKGIQARVTTWQKVGTRAK